MVADLEIDPALLEEAKTLAGLSTPTETVNEALKEYIKMRQREQLLQLKGQIDYYEDYDYKALRRKDL